jgi:hypothetical protein
MTRQVYGTAGGTGCVLACVRGPPRQPRCARRRSHRCGPTTRRPSRGDARPPPPLQHLSAPHRSDIYTSSDTPSRCITRSAAEIHDAPSAPASKQHEAPSVQVDGGNLPAAEGNCYVRSPCTRLTRYSSLGGQRRDILRRAE